MLNWDFWLWSKCLTHGVVLRTSLDREWVSYCRLCRLWALFLVFTIQAIPFVKVLLFLSGTRNVDALVGLLMAGLNQACNISNVLVVDECFCFYLASHPNCILRIAHCPSHGWIEDFTVQTLIVEACHRLWPEEILWTVTQFTSWLVPLGIKSMQLNPW